MKRIAVTGAAGQIAYSFLFRAAHGDLFEQKEKIELYLCDVPGTESILEGVAMELEDCAFPWLHRVQVGADPFQMFDKADLCLLIGAKPRGPGMERADLLLENGKIFVEQGKALNASAQRDVKVVVVGNPCNTNCLIVMHHASQLSRKNFHAMMRLDQNRAVAQLAKKASAEVKEVCCVTVWGNHSSTQIPDYTHAKIGKAKVEERIQDRHWLQEEFVNQVQQRGAEIIKQRGKSSAASAASALVDAVKSLYTSTPQGEWFTSAVCTDNNPYGIEPNLIFGFPCRANGKGDYEIVPDLPFNFFIKEKIAVTQKELIAERTCVESLFHE
jgi:malate dehydrogenase